MSKELGPIEYLHYMGITCWQERSVAVSQTTLLQKLAKQVSTCEKCSLSKTRTQTVFSRGNPGASLMLIGEAPGFYEDQQGKPFVGKAGKLLDAMLTSIGLQENDVYIANVLKCRPPDNREPAPEEILACRDYLEQQIVCVAPKLILALGQFAGQFLLGKSSSLDSLRLMKHRYQQIPFFVTYHPAYLLRNPADKKYVYQDLLLVKNALNE